MSTLHQAFDRMTAGTDHRAHVLPFVVMTPEQQTDHLMTAHGFDSGGWGTDLSDGEVRDNFLLMTRESRTMFHDEDGHGDDLLACRHRHDKTV